MKMIFAAIACAIVLVSSNVTHAASVDPHLIGAIVQPIMRMAQHQNRCDPRHTNCGPRHVQRPVYYHGSARLPDDRRAWRQLPATHRRPAIVGRPMGPLHAHGVSRSRAGSVRTERRTHREWSRTVTVRGTAQVHDRLPANWDVIR